MLGLFLCIVAANAAVIRNGTTSGGSEASETALPPARVGAAAETGEWTWSFVEFTTVSATFNPNPTPTPNPWTHPHLRPQAYPIFALTRKPEEPYIGLASPYANSYAMQRGHTHSDENLRSECYKSFTASQDPWFLSAPIEIWSEFPQKTETGTSTGYTTVTASWSALPTTITDGEDESRVYSALPTTITAEPSIQTHIYESYTDYTYVTPFSWSAAGECCWTCTIVGGTHVQVNYWPKTQEDPPVSTIVDEKGFTFVSPSIYVAFETLYATNLCGTTGPVYGPTTLAFGPTELSTVRAYRWDFDAYLTAPPLVFQSIWTQADWGDQVSCANTELSFYQYGTMRTYDNLEELSSDVITGTNTVTSDSVHLYTVTWNNCSPSLSVPTEILTLNSDWNVCSEGLNGIYDPPYALKPKGELVEPTTTPHSDPPTSSTTKASEVSTPDPPTVTPTPTKEPITEPDPTPTHTPDPPSQTPPSQTPPSQTPPSQNPPSQTPPSQDPPSQNPPSQTPPSQNPPSQNPPSQNPPTQNPPSATGQPGNNDPNQSPTARPGNSDPNQPPTNRPGGNDPNQQPTPRPTSSAAVIIIGSSTIPADSSSGFVIGSQTLTPGGQITAGGTTISLGTDGSSVVVDGSTVPVTSAPVIQPTGFIVGSQTLAPGGNAITVSGEEVSLGADGSSVVVGGTTKPLSEYLGDTTTTATGLGDIIASFGGFDTQTETSTRPSNTFVDVNDPEATAPTQFTGGAESSRSSLWATSLLAGIVILVVGIM